MSDTEWIGDIVPDPVVLPELPAPDLRAPLPELDHHVAVSYMVKDRNGWFFARVELGSEQWWTSAEPTLGCAYSAIAETIARPEMRRKSPPSGSIG